MTLARPCKHCGAKTHFDFMCRWLQTNKGVKKEPKVKAEPVMYIDDYPCYLSSTFLDQAITSAQDKSDDSEVEVSDSSSSQSSSSASAKTTPSPDRGQRTAGKTASGN